MALSVMSKILPHINVTCPRSAISARLYHGVSENFQVSSGIDRINRTALQHLWLFESLYRHRSDISSFRDEHIKVLRCQWLFISFYGHRSDVCHFEMSERLNDSITGYLQVSPDIDIIFRHFEISVQHYCDNLVVYFVYDLSRRAIGCIIALSVNMDHSGILWPAMLTYGSLWYETPRLATSITVSEVSRTSVTVCYIWRFRAFWDKIGGIWPEDATIGPYA